MSKKKVIDKEVLDKLKSNAKKLIENTIGQTQKIHEARLSELETIEALATEIDTDQSIDIIKIIGWMRDKGYDRKASQSIAEIIHKYATEQDLISKAREKEFAEWCSTNKFIYSNDVKAWYHKNFANFISKHFNVWYTTEELFNQFTNREKP